METVTVSVSLLENLIAVNLADQARYQALGLERMAQWHEGRAMAYKFLLTEFGS